ncbi:hypothetical protein L1987_86279 [Smallanthus sonchifolius]|uniref:Uncharacterized protein n=1 Tax=Smallanthus sonchifolius TaxID=185202 RepID=A0ACB8XYB9_9ASTR|nr:hypothetical protein L1987_86279 [Smallanthus sonchifolius]
MENFRREFIEFWVGGEKWMEGGDLLRANGSISGRVITTQLGTVFANSILNQSELTEEGLLNRKVPIFKVSDDVGVDV